MKRNVSQIFVALVCALLGFLLAYQFKLLNKENKVANSKLNADIIAEIESLKKEKEQLTKENEEISQELKKLEDIAAQEGLVEAEITKQLNNTRMHLGVVDVKGPGLTLTLTPKSNIFGGNTTDVTKTLKEDELVYIVNSLWFAGAEAISINDYRITPQTGIKDSGNHVWIGKAGRVNPNDKIEIKAIGDKGKLETALTFAENLNYKALGSYKQDIVQSDEIEILASKESVRTDFIKPVKE